MKKAEYGEGERLASNPNRFNEEVTAYDKTGNILGIRRMGQTGAQEYGLVDNLALTYSGNQLKKVTDNAASSAYNNGFEFKDGADRETEYTYDENGNLTQDLNRNIEDIQYNFLNLPQRIEFEDGSTTEYLYDAEGRKLRTLHKADGKTTTTDYAGNLIYENGNPARLLTGYGYVSLLDGMYHYYLQDHLENNRVVADRNGKVEEVNHYYPFGGMFPTTGNVQPYKYNGKELDTRKGLNWYDYGARYYDPALGRFTVVDSIIEHVSYEQYENVISNTCINDCNEYKQNLLHEAIACCRNDIATNLINRNNINQQDYKGETPLHYCAAYFNLEIAELLLQKKAQINIIDKYGNNPLWVAVFNAHGDYRMVKLFLKYNANIQNKNRANRSPLDFAKQINDLDLVNILLHERSNNS